MSYGDDFRKLIFGEKTKLMISDNVRTPTTIHASHRRPARKYRRVNATSDVIITQAGTCSQRTISPSCSGVCARINANSSPAKGATEIASTDKARLARSDRAFNQTNNSISASVMHPPAPIDHMTVTQLKASVSQICEVYPSAASSRKRCLFDDKS